MKFELTQAMTGTRFKASSTLWLAMTAAHFSAMSPWQNRGEWDANGEDKASGNEALCAGAMIFLEKLGRPPQWPCSPTTSWS